MRIIKFDGDLLRKTVNEIVRITELQGVPWKRFSEFNRLLKGFRPNELTILSGRTGIGKTTFACEYSLDLAEQGVPTLWGSFEMPLRKICRTLLQQYSGEPLFGEDQDKVHLWANMFSKNVPMYFMNMQGCQIEADVFESLEEGVRSIGISHAVLDNLQFLLGVGGGSGSGFEDRFLRQDRFIQKIRAFASNSGCHVTLIAHPRKEGDGEGRLTVSSLYGGAKLSQESDNILLIQQENETAFPKKYVQLVKNRYDGTLGSVDLRFQSERLSFRPQVRDLVYDVDKAAVVATEWPPELQ